MVKTIVKKVGAQPLSVDEINFFRDDNTILHFKNPEGIPFLTQLMPPSKTTLSSSVAILKPKLLRTSSLTSSNNLAPNNTNYSKNSSPTSHKAQRKSPISWNKHPPPTWTQSNEHDSEDI